MTTNEKGFRSITEQFESAEPAPSNGQVQNAASAGTASTNNVYPPTSTSENGPSAQMRPQALSGPRSLTISGSPSTANSPMSSRDNSPARPPLRQQGASGPLPKSGLRSRKSSTDVSPSRGPSLAGSGTTIPSAAAIQRALSSASTPQLQPTSAQDPSKVPRPQKAGSGTASGESTPHWPVSPRLKSPPPAAESRSRSRRDSLRAQSRKSESTSSAPAIVVQSSSPASSSRIPIKNEVVNSDSEDQAPLIMKGSARGVSGAAPTLETVQEASLPATPGFNTLETQSLAPGTQGGKSSDEERPDVAASKVTEDLSTKTTKAVESGSDSGPNKAENRGRSKEHLNTSTQRPKAIPAKSSFSSLAAIKPRSAAETTSKNMTVETETVTSIPQAAIGGPQGERVAQGRGDPSGSLRLKPSNETIRPKKDRKKATRKAPSINAGTASSKADVFEAKVASAVDEENSSDSDETFVYESNPPDPPPQRNRHHSRTPSMTSIASMDPRTAIREAHKVNGKRSMKFANNPYIATSPDNDANDRLEGTVRGGTSRASGGSSIHHHHIGRHGHGRGGAHHTSLFDQDSPFPQSSKIRAMSSRHSSKPNSPKEPNYPSRLGNGNGNRNGNGNGNGNGNSSKKNGEYSMYDMDNEGTADDERTPLIGTVRVPRTRTPRRPNSASLRQLEHYQRRRSGGWFHRFAGCLVLSILLLVLIFGAVGLLFATTKPLYGVGIREIQNVIASEQELMLDLFVEAINPNIIAVTVADMDVNLFAKSKHLGTDKWWRDHHGAPFDSTSLRDRDPPRRLPLNDPQPHHALPSPHDQDIRTSGGIDEGTDPIEDPEEGDSQTMLLGRIFHFDSALNFDGSPIKRHPHYSIGEVRLQKPGNKTEAGGTERWERVLQFPFELIVRGILKYQLPLSTRIHTVPISGSYMYDPEEEKKKLKVKSVRIYRGHIMDDELEEKRELEVWGRWDARARQLIER